jgi:serine/threonine-protein kinase ULK/ATG1
MKKIKCQNSVEYYDNYSDNDFYYIVMEKCDEDLSKLIERNKNKGGLSDIMIKNILLQLNEAFKIMHSKNIIHRDLKPQNILIKYIHKNEFIIKVADFGLSRVFYNEKFSTNLGSTGYNAPEQSEGNYDPSKCDLWSIGVIIYELKYNQIPIIAFYNGAIPETFENKLLDDLVRKLIVVDPNKRIDWDEYFEHPFFKK